MKYKLFLLIILGFFMISGCDQESSNAENKSISDTGKDVKNTVPVEALEIKERIIDQQLELTGILIPKNSVDLVAEVSGKVGKIYKELGDYVSANETLALIDDVIPESQLNQAKAQVLSTESNLKIAETNLKSDKVLFENGDISEFEYNNSKLTYKNAEAQQLSAQAALKAAQKTYEDTRIKSPISGLISRKNISFGTMVAIGSIAFRVVDLSSLKLKVAVPQELINRVQIGDRANVIISALNGQSFQGKVKRVSPQADEITGGFAVEIEVENTNKIIKAGMTARIELMITKEQKVLAIPEYSLVTKENENYVYKITDEFAQLVKVELGETIGQNVIIKDGVSIGDKIVVVGMKNLGVKTKVYIEKLN